MEREIGYVEDSTKEDILKKRKKVQRKNPS